MEMDLGKLPAVLLYEFPLEMVLDILVNLVDVEMVLVEYVLVLLVKVELLLEEESLLLEFLMIVTEFFDSSDHKEVLYSKMDS